MLLPKPLELDNKSGILYNSGMMNTYDKLDLAENLAEKHGDLFMFKLRYAEARQYYGVIQSIESALKQQNLYEIYRSKI